ncbi:MAG: S-methyl-5'-thioadenosine phosphorylase [Dehalococcoidia bacterium]|nr:S-methyl-5'-thioadenosine phosphorylase [Dehalococcoidia bacterium]
MPQAKIGVIGGTGLYEIEGMKNVQEVKAKTPFGEPSDSIVVGTLEGTNIAFLPRHGRGHRISPSELPARANIYALKSLGVEYIIAINSCGSFKEDLKPRDLVIPNQIIDRTRGRQSTFFDNGIVAHIAFSQPFCPALSQILYLSAKEVGADVHQGGTFIAMEGPQFSTKAESRLYKSWGADIIGMTVLPEAKLAREAEICYACVACVTDYDSWHDQLEPVRVEDILNILSQNIEAAKGIIRIAASHIPVKRDCECSSALSTAIMTTPDLIPAKTRKNLELLIGKYVK